MLDLMVLCWCQQPRDRPSASQIVSIASAPEFTHLYDVVSLNHSGSVISTVTASVSQTPGKILLFIFSYNLNYHLLLLLLLHWKQNILFSDFIFRNG